MKTTTEQLGSVVRSKEKATITVRCAHIHIIRSTANYTLWVKAETYDIDYIIQCDKGVGVYELPIEYSCPSHKYEEIHFGITADRSCYVSYYIELYANDDLLFETEEKGTYLNISSVELPSANDSTVS